MMGGIQQKAEPVLLVPTLVAVLAAKITGDTSEHNAAYVNVPGALLGLFGSLELIPLIDSGGGAGAVSATLRIITGTVVGSTSGTVMINQATLGTTNTRIKTNLEIFNQGSASVQVAWPAASVGFGGSSNANADAAINTNLPFTVSLNLKLANGADSAWLRAMRVVAWPRAA